MNIKYVGPKPHITQHGISFESGKEDKYVYLMIAVQILQAIDHDFGEQKSYSYDVNTKRLKEEEILKTLLQYDSDLEEKAKEEARDYSQKLAEEMGEVKESQNLSESEKEAFIANLEIMKEYRIQRAINKIYYMHTALEISNIIKREGIKEIDTPFYEKYWHVLRTVQGKLDSGKASVKSQLKIEKNHEGKMATKLFIGNI